MQCGTRLVVVVGLTFLACLGPGIHSSEAQVTIESVIPAQVPRGQTTVLNVAFPGRDLMVQGAEIAPSTGVSVSGVRRAVDSQGVAWWEVTVDVARDAAPGDRLLVLVMPRGRSLPATITVPGHVPGLSDLKVMSAGATQATVELQFTAADEAADLGGAPYVWFTLGCAESLVGAVRGVVTPQGARSGVVRASIPVPGALRSGPAGRACGLTVRATDSQGIESNTLNTTVDFRN